MYPLHSDFVTLYGLHVDNSDMSMTQICYTDETVWLYLVMANTAEFVYMNCLLAVRFLISTVMQ